MINCKAVSYGDVNKIGTGSIIGEYNRKGVNNMFVLFKSLTTAIRVQEKLQKYGIKSFTVQTTKNPGRADCGHALKLDNRYLPRVKSIAAEMGIEIKGVYYE